MLEAQLSASPPCHEPTPLFPPLGAAWQVHLSMLGACASCASSTVTLRFQIKNTLMHYFPEVKDVQAVDMADDEDVFKDKG